METDLPKPWAFRYVAPQRLLGRGSLLLRWLGNLVPRCPAKTGGSGSTSLRSERRKSPGVSGRGPATWSAAGRLAPTEAREGTRLHSQACGVCRGRWRRSRGADSGGGGGVAATRRVYVVRRLATCSLSLSPLSAPGRRAIGDRRSCGHVRVALSTIRMVYTFASAAARAWSGGVSGARDSTAMCRLLRARDLFLIVSSYCVPALIYLKVRKNTRP